MKHAHEEPMKMGRRDNTTVNICLTAVAFGRDNKLYKNMFNLLVKFSMNTILAPLLARNEF
ncbi:Uncharacterized protein APZ42_013738 [Daphnia magna]|uniref:Uncharacterized protein n=1 Tax=Daphnia magna TaxID=35525 RepID=A0A162QJM7_9CRUS|nr:Uncharacterized protein APZ42_013738 [Daphnia magna]